MAKHILITGGTGLLGSRITEILQEKGHKVAHLSRKKNGSEAVPTYKWDVTKQIVEKGALEEAKAIIHLAGANVAGERWTENYKDTILKSRTESSHLLYQKLQQTSHSVEVMVSSSASGYYGADAGDKICTEEMRPGSDFLAYVTKEWEQKVQLIDKLSIRRVTIRTGIVLTDKGGALPKIMMPVKVGAGAALGSGRQYMSWIHLEDICQIFVKAIEDQNMSGVYNGVSPEPVTNHTFTKTAAKVDGKPFFLPNVPAFALKLALGEMALTVLGGQRVSSRKIEAAGFLFQYPALKQALEQIL